MSNKNRKRNRVLFFLIIFFILAGAGYALYYYNYGRYRESTDNAYVTQNIVYITPQIPGVVSQVLVQETQFVKQGELLGTLDTRDANISFNRAKAALAQTVREVKREILQKQEAEEAIKLAQIKLQKAKKDFIRNQSARVQNALTAIRFDNVKFAYQAARENLKLLQQKLKSLEALVKDSNIPKNPQVINAVLQLKEAYLNLQRCNIYAPISGTVAKKNFNIGQSVSARTSLLAIVPKSGFWVEANFKETQLKNIRIGQSATLISDFYGKDVKFHGKVAGISPGTGAVFSLIPPQNATGNWIKIVQRIPIRIELDTKELQKHPLAAGSSMTVTIDLKSKKGKPLKRLKKKSQNSLILYKKAMQKAQKIAQEIIRQNS